MQHIRELAEADLAEVAGGTDMEAEQPVRPGGHESPLASLPEGDLE